MFVPNHAKRGLSPVEIPLPSSLWIAVNREISTKARKAPKRLSHGVMQSSLEGLLFADKGFMEVRSSTIMMSVGSCQWSIAKIVSAVAPLTSLEPLFLRKLGENQITREMKGDGVAAMAFFYLIWNEGRFPFWRKRGIAPVDRIKGNQRGTSGALHFSHGCDLDRFCALFQ
jgi:hypothetical protein